MLLMMDSINSSADDHHSISEPDQGIEEEEAASSSSVGIMNIITGSTCSSSITWKLYHNPFYSSNSHLHTTPSPSSSLRHKHFLRKYSASFNHKLTDSEMCSKHWVLALDQARTQIAELKTQLELERKVRKKVESLNKKMSRELADRLDQEMKMSDEVSKLKTEIQDMKKYMEEERKMLRLAEVFREERLQMKLADAHHLYNQTISDSLKPAPAPSPGLSNITNVISSTCASDSKRSTLIKTTDTCNIKYSSSGSSSSSINPMPNSVNRKASPEPENPHIKRGIKGFVEFPRAFKAVNGSSPLSLNRKHCRSDIGIANKLECQKAQLQIMFKTNKSPLRSHSHSHPLLLS